MWCGVVHTDAKPDVRNEDFTSKEEFTKRDLSLVHLTWLFKGEMRDYLSPAELMSLSEGDYAIITPPPSKADPFGMRWGSKPISLPFSPTDQICAARALRDVELLQSISGAERRATPLLRMPDGAPLSRSHTASLLRDFVKLIVPDERVKDYTMHSFHIYLRNALAAAGVDDAKIQACLRWASVDALNTYRMAYAAQYASWLRAAMSAHFVVRRGASAMRADGSAIALPRVDSTDRAVAILEEQLELLELANREGG